MTSEAFTFRAERLADDAAIEEIHAEAFGPGRYARAAFRLREGVAHDPTLSFVAEADGRVIASVRLTPIRVGGRPALLLGPLAVIPAFKGRGAGKRLVRIALEAARAAGHQVVLLVGDEPYYGPLGFVRLARYAVTLPAPADPDRVLFAGLVPGALDGLAGAATPAL
jgi:predicted N-acetyltransferase YhbS